MQTGFCVPGEMPVLHGRGFRRQGTAPRPPGRMSAGMNFPRKRSHFAGPDRHSPCMNNQPTQDKLAASRETIRQFGRHYDYDASYLEELMDASAAAFQAFEAAMPMARVRKAAPVDLMMIAKLAAMRAQDCGPCTLLTVKIAREAGVAEEAIRSVLRGGEGLPPMQRDVHDYARALALNEDMEAGLLPRLVQNCGRETLAELAVNIIATKLYPTLKRALGHQQSCSLIPELAA